VKRLVPSPWLSAAIFVGWLLLSRGVGAGAVLLGLLLALAVPPLFAPLRPTPGPVRRWGTLARLIGRVGVDVVRSALQVAGGVLVAGHRPPRGRFVRVPMLLRDPHALAALAVITAVVPGTIWTELAADGSTLLLHVFDPDDDDAAFVERFERDYERPLREIFE
jgi:multicomponent K+:H+ antiporter subunit E